MKKLILTICVALIGFSAANAQDGQVQGQRQGNSRGSEMREQMKKAFKEELKFTDVQIDTVLSVQQQFQMKTRQVRMDANLGEDQKTAQLKTLGDERKEKLKTVLNDEQITKLDAYYETMRKNRSQGGNRQSGGNGNGGTTQQN
ncbi:MAG: hypothetical protein JWQ96_235 [Segetibacter sp.]|nr:hypothetical protein [Segetibacter sp.]